MASFFGVLALMTWTWFIVQNNRFFKLYKYINVQEWVSLLGFATSVWTLAITAFYCLWKNDPLLKTFWNTDTSLLAWFGASVILGVGSSWLANYLWISASQRLSLTLGGLLTVLETLFGLLFIFVWQRALPSLLNLMGAVCILAGVGFAIYLLQEKEKMAQLECT
jgi:drug/metabolite transporter (DMT)-like permease